MTKGSVPSTGFHVEQNSDLTVNKSHDIGMQCIQSTCLGYWVLKIILWKTESEATIYVHALVHFYLVLLLNYIFNFHLTHFNMKGMQDFD